MKKIFLCQILVIFICVSVYSQKTQNEKFVGVFQECFMHCATYYINADFTFKYRFMGNERNGTWKYNGKNKIKLYASPKKEETLVFSGKNNSGEMVDLKLKIPKIPAFKRIFIFQNDSICPPDNKEKAEFCYKKIETNSPSI